MATPAPPPSHIPPPPNTNVQSPTPISDIPTPDLRPHSTTTSSPSQYQTPSQSQTPPQSRNPPRPAQRYNPHTPQLPSPSTGPTSNIDIRHSAPLPLTASQEAEVRDLYYAKVRTACSTSIAAFATCAAGRTVSVSWACRAQRRGMNECMNGIAGREAEDVAREEWFGDLEGRREKREEEERWKEEQRVRKREWWGLDEQGRRRVVEDMGRDADWKDKLR